MYINALLMRPVTARFGSHLPGLRADSGRAQARRNGLFETARQLETLNEDEAD
jgi:hypothetical protein